VVVLTEQLLNQNTFSKFLQKDVLEDQADIAAISPGRPFSQVEASAPKPQRLSRDQVKDLGRAYEEGATLSELAEKYKINRGTVSAHLKRLGIPTRYRILEWNDQTERV
jgi:DNA-binding MarR family transcriptional regulator